MHRNPVTRGLVPHPEDWPWSSYRHYLLAEESSVLLTPPAGTLSAKKVLIIGLGDSPTFTPDRMYLVGKIAFREANRLGIAHPFFAPTILDGGVSGFSTGDIAEKVVSGLRDALTTETLLQANHASTTISVKDFTFLAGAKNVATTQTGINRALGQPH